MWTEREKREFHRAATRRMWKRRLIILAVVALYVAFMVWAFTTGDQSTACLDPEGYWDC